jgi:hypothetical protein
MGMKAAVVSKALKDALLNGTLDKMAPIIRLGNDRYVRYDKIVVRPECIDFYYEEEHMLNMPVRIQPGDTVTIEGLEGRMKMEVK